MKIGLFITDDIFIKEQILYFLDLAPRLDLNHNDFHIFVKQPHVRKVVVGTNQKQSVLEKVTMEKIKIFFNRKLLRWRIAPKWQKLCDLASIHEIDSINSSATQNLLDQVDIGVFINFDEIVKATSLSKIKRPFNMHNGILPNYRGCQPIVWQMLGKERLSAMTFHVMTEGIDDGDVVFESPFYIDLRKGVYFNNIQSFQTIPATLFFGLRRLLFCNTLFIKQDDFSISPRYFKRPSIQDIRKIYS